MAIDYDFTARKGSTARSLYFTLSSTNPTDSFSGVVGVKFYMRLRSAATNKIDGADVAVFTIAGDNKSIACRYDWSPQDVNQDGDFQGYAKTTDGTGKTDRFPADDTGEFIKIKFLKSFE